MAAEWYYTKDGTKFGPIDAATLKQLADNGALRPDDLVWKQGAKQWVAASNVKGLFTAAAITREDHGGMQHAWESPLADPHAASSVSDIYPVASDPVVMVQGSMRPVRKKRTFPALAFVAGMFTLVAMLIMAGGVICFLVVVSNAIRNQNEFEDFGLARQSVYAIAGLVFAAAVAIVYLAVAESIKLGLYAVSILEEIRNQG